jgi:4-amino-4-deoxy-L-arabinose transferase-like glycosyltransferase
VQSPSPHRILIPGARAALPLWMLYPVFFAAVYFSHLTLLRLPYFWDEGGYYIPAAWDFFRTGTLIPFTTLSNAHPPLPAILLAGWWRLSGFVPSGTRTFLCMVTAGALLAVYRLARHLLGSPAAVATTLLTAIYPIWFAQSTLDHGDLFAAAFTLWGLTFYLESISADAAQKAANPGAPHPGVPGELARWGERRESEMWVPARHKIYAAIFFSLAALSKETGVITPVALALWEAFLSLRDRKLRRRAGWIAALLVPVLPLAAWYVYHRHRTGYAFGNPDFLRYNATANLDAHRVALGLYHRFLHLTMHMNMFVPVICALAALLMPAIASRVRLSRPVLSAIAVVLLVNWIAFSVLGGALLTRYLLAMYPLVILVCVAEWQRRLQHWEWLAALSAAAFIAGIWINPPYSFAPEDNLTYRDMIVLHQRAIDRIVQQWPQATVLTAWPANSELERPELGYTKHPIKAFPILNFSIAEIEKAASEPDDYDLALLFSTKWNPPPGRLNLGHSNTPADARYFGFHEDVRPAQAAAILHGELVWQASNHGEWVAILRFPRIQDASLHTR